MQERMLGLKGYWRDRITYGDGRVELVGGEFSFNDNQIQNTCASLLASLVGGDLGYVGVQYLALGSGAVGWDAITPVIDFDQTTLTAEEYRKAITRGTDTTFLDPVSYVDLGPLTPSPLVEISVVLAPGEGTGTLREFGLFGGNAGAGVDTGYLLNHVVHPKIEKDLGTQIERTMRLRFLTQ